MAYRNRQNGKSEARATPSGEEDDISARSEAGAMPGDEKDDVMRRLEKLRVIKRNDVRRYVLYSIQHLGRLERDGKFPKRVRLGANRVGWYAIDIEAWLLAKGAGSV